MRGKVGVGLACCIYSEEKQLLLIRRKGAHGNGEWSVPGGWMEQGETPEEGVAREVIEEVGLSVGPSDMKFMNYVHTVHPEGFGDVTLWFKCSMFVDDISLVEIKEPDKIDGIGWFHYWEFPKPLFNPILQQLTNYQLFN